MGLFFFAFTLERMTRTTAAPRNKDLIPGVPRFSRAAMYGKRGNRKDRQWKPVQAKNDKAIAEPTPVVKDFNGGKRTILPKATKIEKQYFTWISPRSSFWSFRWKTCCFLKTIRIWSSFSHWYFFFLFYFFILVFLLIIYYN